MKNQIKQLAKEFKIKYISGTDVIINEESCDVLREIANINNSKDL